MARTTISMKEIGGYNLGLSHEPGNCILYTKPFSLIVDSDGDILVVKKYYTTDLTQINRAVKVIFIVLKLDQSGRLVPVDNIGDKMLFYRRGCCDSWRRSCCIGKFSTVGQKNDFLEIPAELWDAHIYFFNHQNIYSCLVDWSRSISFPALLVAQNSLFSSPTYRPKPI